MAKNYVILFKIFIFLYTSKDVNCGQNKLIFDLTPSFPENSQFSYHITVNCHGEHGTVAKTIVQHKSLASDNSMTFLGEKKHFERNLFDFNEIKCRQYSVFIRISRMANTESKTYENSTVIFDGGKIAETNGTTNWEITLNLFFVNIISVIEQQQNNDQFYEMKVYCNDKNMQPFYHASSFKCWNGGCQRIINVDEQKCPKNAYDIQLWSWDNLNQQQQNIKNPRPKSTYFSKKFINYGEVVNIQHNGNGFEF